MKLKLCLVELVTLVKAPAGYILILIITLLEKNNCVHLWPI